MLSTPMLAGPSDCLARTVDNTGKILIVLVELLDNEPRSQAL